MRLDRCLKYTFERDGKGRGYLSALKRFVGDAMSLISLLCLRNDKGQADDESGLASVESFPELFGFYTSFVRDV